MKNTSIKTVITRSIIALSLIGIHNTTIPMLSGARASMSLARYTKALPELLPNSGTKTAPKEMGTLGSRSWPTNAAMTALRAKKPSNQAWSPSHKALLGGLAMGTVGVAVAWQQKDQKRSWQEKIRNCAVRATASIPKNGVWNSLNLVLHAKAEIEKLNQEVLSAELTKMESDKKTDLIKKIYTSQDPKLIEWSLAVIVPQINDSDLINLAKYITDNHPEQLGRTLPVIVPRIAIWDILPFAQYVSNNAPDQLRSVLKSIIPHCEQICPKEEVSNHLIAIIDLALKMDKELFFEILPILMPKIEELKFTTLIRDLHNRCRDLKILVEAIAPYCWLPEADIAGYFANAIRAKEIEQSEIPQRYLDIIKKYELPQSTAKINSNEWWDHQITKYFQQAHKNNCESLYIKKPSTDSDQRPIRDCKLPYSPEWTQSMGNAIAHRIGAQPYKYFTLASSFGAYNPYWKIILVDSSLSENSSLFTLIARLVHEYTHSLQEPAILKTTCSISIRRQKEIEADLLCCIVSGTPKNLSKFFAQFPADPPELIEIHPDSAKRTEYLKELIRQCATNETCTKNYINGRVFLLNLVAITRYNKDQEEKNAPHARPQSTELRKVLTSSCTALNSVMQELGHEQFSQETFNVGIKALAEQYNELNDWTEHLIDICDDMIRIYPQQAATITNIKANVAVAFKQYSRS